jgi:hypothetical protein
MSASNNDSKLIFEAFMAKRSKPVTEDVDGKMPEPSEVNTDTDVEGETDDEAREVAIGKEILTHVEHLKTGTDSGDCLDKIKTLAEELIEMHTNGVPVPITHKS